MMKLVFFARLDITKKAAICSFFCDTMFTESVTNLHSSHLQRSPAAKSTTELPPPRQILHQKIRRQNHLFRHFLGCLELGYPVNLVHDHHGFLNFRRHRLCFRNKDKDDHDNNNEW
jgi:hypothetical protein